MPHQYEQQQSARRCGGYASLIAACALLLPMAAFAASWDYLPRFSTGVQYETNTGYTTDNQDDGYSTVVSGAIKFTGETQRGRFSAEPRIDTNYYGTSQAEKDRNTIDYFLPLSAEWASERTNWGVQTGYSYVSTNDFEVTDPNNPSPTGQYSRIRVNDDQQLIYLSPSVSFRFSERDIGALSINATDVQYNDAELTGRSNYDNYSATATWSHAIGLQSRITSSLTAALYSGNRPSRLLTPNELPPLNPFLNPSQICLSNSNQFELCEIDNDTATYGLDAGYEYALTPTITVGIIAGISRSDIEISGTSLVDADENIDTPDLPCYDADQQVFVRCTLKTDDKTFTGRMFYDQRTGKTITTGFSIGRAVVPSSDGAVVTNDVANAYVSKQFSPRLSGTLGVNYTRQEAVGASSAERAAARFDFKYERLDASLNWSLTPTVSVSAAYHYSKDEQKSGFSYNVDNNTINLSIAYTGRGHR